MYLRSSLYDPHGSILPLSMSEVTTILIFNQSLIYLWSSHLCIILKMFKFALF